MVTTSLTDYITYEAIGDKSVMASKKTAETLPHCYTVSVVGLSGTEAIKGKGTV